MHRLNVFYIKNVTIRDYANNRIMNSEHMFDATEIFKTLPAHKKESFVKLGFYLLCFFYFLYRMIEAMIGN